jgi:hypothetical protein
VREERKDFYTRRKTVRLDQQQAKERKEKENCNQKETIARVSLFLLVFCCLQEAKQHLNTKDRLGYI